MEDWRYMVEPDTVAERKPEELMRVPRSEATLEVEEYDPL
jgi:hypothetical protein